MAVVRAKNPGSVKPERCQTCGRLKRRGNAMNSRYWLLLHLIADKLRPEGKQFTAEAYHEYFKLRYLGADEIALPNGKTVQRARSSADLDKDEFAEYMMRVEQWANERDVYMDEMEVA